MLRSDPWFLGRTARLRQAWSAAATVYGGKTSSLVGGTVERFEAAAARGLGADSAMAVASATSGIELILQDLGIGPGHEVVVPAFGWMSVPGTVVYRGAGLRVVDVDRGLHSSWDAIEAALSEHTRAIVIVHMRGIPNPETPRIVAEAKRRGITVIEDCAQAWGATIDGESVGRFGDYGVFSTQHFKLIATGEGGVVIGEDADALARLRWLCGQSGDPNSKLPWPRNTRMPEVVAATGIPQLRSLPRTVAALRFLAEQVTEIATVAGRLRVDPPPSGHKPNGVCVPLWCDDATQAQQLAAAFNDAGVQAFRPGDPGDRHNAGAWPLNPPLSGAPGLAALACYVDVPIPKLAGPVRRVYLKRVETVLKG